MMLNIYAVFDKATQAYMRPFFMQADGQAVRGFTDEAVRADSEISKHPEDYALFRIGEYDDNTGVIVPCEPFCVGRAHELAASTRQRENLQMDLAEIGKHSGVNGNA